MAVELYLYCVTRAGHAPPAGLLGLADAAVAAFDAGDLALWTSALAAPAAADLDAIRRHNAVVEAALTPLITPVPLRFGQRITSSDELLASVAERRVTWHELLDLFAGALEFGIRVVDPDADTARIVQAGPAATGRDYLSALAQVDVAAREAQAAAETVAAALRGAVATFVRRERIEPLRTPRGMASIAHLVPHSKFEDYRAAVHGAFARLPAYRFLLSGPWPPYSFVT